MLETFQLHLFKHLEKQPQNNTVVESCRGQSNSRMTNSFLPIPNPNEIHTASSNLDRFPQPDSIVSRGCYSPPPGANCSPNFKFLFIASRASLECHNCSNKGHIAAQCPYPIMLVDQEKGK
ncbi:hypothetical protein RJ639_023734, partial [Escallonia herrerae]